MQCVINHLGWLRMVPMAMVLLTTSCSRRIPNDIASSVESNLPIAIKVAEDAAKLCPQLKASAPFNPNPMAAPPPPPSPAGGSALEKDSHVLDVLIVCNWPNPPDSIGAMGMGIFFPPLKNKVGVPVRFVTMPEDYAKDTCRANPDSCERIVVPSRYASAENTADIRITRKTVDGTVEVVVVIVP